MTLHAASVSAPTGTDTSDRMQSFRRLLDRGRLAVSRTRLEYVFLVIALAWGVAQVFIVPPLQVPDEGDHWFRAWAMTDGQLTAESDGMVTLPGRFARAVDLYLRLVDGIGRVPVTLDGLAGFSGYEDLFIGTGGPGPVRVPSRVSNYGPIGYLPQAVGVGLGRLVGAPPLTSFYLARLANLFAAVALLFVAIRLAPFGKQLFVLLALLPMTMFELASVSCDALTIAGAIFFTSLLLWASTRPALRRVDLALVVVAAALLLNVKPGYWALVLLVLLITPAQLGGRSRYLAFVAVNAVVVIGAFLAVVLLTGTDSRLQDGASHGQLLFILQDPMGFLGILWSNLRENLLAWMLQSIGALGWLTITLPPTLYLFVLITALVFFFRMGEERVGLDPWQRTLLAGVGVVVFVTMAIALYAFLEPPGSERVFVQGRYLAPVWLLLLLSVYGIPVGHRYRGVPLLVGMLLLLMVQNLHALISTYYP